MATTIGQDFIEELAELDALPPADLIEAINHGLPAALATELAASLEISQEYLARLLRLTPRTLQRRLERGRLDLGESERLWELARLLRRAEEVLESRPAAVQWLRSPIQALGWKTPLALAHTAVGLREVESILGRIEHGVFS
jgi:putative toxin-antitoxin system antitoxin component (TIGR02293 family)